MDLEGIVYWNTSIVKTEDVMSLFRKMKLINEKGDPIIDAVPHPYYYISFTQEQIDQDREAKFYVKADVDYICFYQMEQSYYNAAHVFFLFDKEFTDAADWTQKELYIMKNLCVSNINEMLRFPEKLALSVGSDEWISYLKEHYNIKDI